MAIAKEQLRQIIKGNDIQNVGDIYNLLRDNFKDMVFITRTQNFLHYLKGCCTHYFYKQKNRKA